MYKHLTVLVSFVSLYKLLHLIRCINVLPLLHDDRVCRFGSSDAVVAIAISVLCRWHPSMKTRLLRGPTASTVTAEVAQQRQRSPGRVLRQESTEVDRCATSPRGRTQTTGGDPSLVGLFR